MTRDTACDNDAMDEATPTGAPAIERALLDVESEADAAEAAAAHLLAADLYLPAPGSTHEGAARVRRIEQAEDVRFPVFGAGEGRYVPVFTSEERVLAAIDETQPYAIVPGFLLSEGWPEDARLVLNPGGEPTASLSAERVRALHPTRAGGPPAPDEDASAPLLREAEEAAAPPAAGGPVDLPRPAHEQEGAHEGGERRPGLLARLFGRR